ncbi:hypothetical protein [Glycomyces tenuis]|uniref:hypothetical protein n=1 Tax=Glycomyces tenuis TaxID=58116 RepID=UPI0003FD4E2D|nr:hypothetical protein [Glycomyces tenuis]
MTLTLVATAFSLAVAYALRCWAFPYGRCVWCRGDGIRGGTYCRRCDGSGHRVRLGRRIHDRIRAEYRNGTR